MNDEMDFIKKKIRSLYLRTVITRSYYHDLSYIHQKRFDDILEIIYWIVKDVCLNEGISIHNVESIGCGSYSNVLCAKDKVIKVGLARGTKCFPNNPYINAMLLRKEFVINQTESFFVEVSERVDTSCIISDEELYQLYRKLRNIHLVWVDVEKRNVGRLLKDNQVYWRECLPLSDEILGLDKYRGTEILKKGDFVILDNDMIFDENSPLLFYQYKSKFYLEFEKRYLVEKEKMLRRRKTYL